MDATPPPLGAKLTGYRLLNITIVFSFGIAKAILTYKGRSTEPTTLDWVGGALLAVFLYWMGQYEQRDSRFFQVDLAPGIGYCAKRVVGGAMGVPFCFSGAFTAVSLSNSAVIPLEHFFPQVPVGAWFGVVIGFYVSAYNLTCSRRPHGFGHRSGGGNLRRTFWTSTDLVRRLRNTCGSVRWER
ncbi:hypothetical protein EDB85DRAFT_1021401 [Lactarius pseudohatsudake]|nr:hypothetical protein EDB85DRAFT_1021401 [Lactarius pseudohatsudake]